MSLDICQNCILHELFRRKKHRSGIEAAGVTILNLGMAHLGLEEGKRNGRRRKERERKKQINK
jgi:hypothetical protein